MRTEPATVAGHNHQNPPVNTGRFDASARMLITSKCHRKIP